VLAQHPDVAGYRDRRLRQLRRGVLVGAPFNDVLWIAKQILDLFIVKPTMSRSKPSSRRDSNST